MTARTGQHLVVSLDGDRVSVVVASVGRRGFSVRRCRATAGVVDPGAVCALVRETLGDEDLASQRIHLMVASAQVVRFSLRMGKLSTAEREIVVQRRARQEAGMSLEAPIRVAYAADPGGQGSVRSYACAGFRDEAIRFATAMRSELHVHVETISCLEDASLKALPADMPEHVVLLERNQRGVRIAYLTSGVLMHERQVLVSGVEGADPVFDASRLRHELARTLDYFGAEGSPPPGGITFTPALGLSEAETAEIADGLPVFALDLPSLPASEEPLPLASVGLLRALAGQAVVPWLDEGCLVGSRRKVFIGLGAVAALVLSIVFLTHKMSDARTAEAERVRLVGVRDALQTEREALEVPVPEPVPETQAPSPAQTHLLSVLQRRRPASHLLTEVLRRTPEALTLLSVGYGADDRIEITGAASAADRRETMRALEALRDHLGELPYLVDLDVKVSYPTSESEEPARFRFTLSARFGVNS